MSLKFRVLVSCACAALAAMLCVLCADHAREEAERTRNEALERYGGETVSLVVAIDGLEAGDVVTSTNVSVRDWITDLAPAEAVTSLDDVMGLRLSEPVAAGAPLTSLNFRERDEVAEIPSGHVAVGVPLSDKLGLSTGAAVGSRVVAYEVGDSATRLLSSDVTVLSAPATSGSAARPGQLSIAVPPDDVTAVLTAGAAGDLRLVQPADDVGDLGSQDVAAPDEVAPAETGE